MGTRPPELNDPPLEGVKPRERLLLTDFPITLRLLDEVKPREPEDRLELL